MPATADIIFSYFPALSEKQKEQFRRLDALYREWNAQINVISRKDIDNLYVHHVLHSLAPAKVISFRPGTSLLDVGTGGGFPGIPLAILFPECSFHLIDSIGKKIKVVSAVSESIGLTNVTATHRNVVEEKGKYDFVLSRGVMNTGEFVKLVHKNVRREPHNSLPNGLLMLKGGDLSGELSPFRHEALTWDISDYFKGEFFEKKKLVFIPVH